MHLILLITLKQIPNKDPCKSIKIDFVLFRQSLSWRQTSWICFHGSYKIPLLYRWIQLSHLLLLLWRLKKCIIELRFFFNFFMFIRTFGMNSAEMNKKFCITLSAFERRLNPTFAAETKAFNSLRNLLKNLNLEQVNHNFNSAKFSI